MLMAQRGRGLFAKLSKRRLKHGVFHSVVDLQAAINRFLANTISNPNPSHGPPTPTKSSPLADFVCAYNFGRRLKILTPYEFICKSGQKSQNDSGSILPTKYRD
jgi:hypothetical protein